MGQASCRSCQSNVPTGQRMRKVNSFPDLARLPPEVAVQVLSHLDATDLCLAGCVNELWSSLANVEVLWKRLCIKTWGEVSAYSNGYLDDHSFKELYMMLDNGTLTFAVDPHEGINYLISNGILDNNPQTIARFIHTNNVISWKSLEQYIRDRADVLECMVMLHEYHNQFLPDALRSFFSKIPAPKERGPFLETLLTHFSRQYLSCNPQLQYTQDMVYLMCYSLILLSVDLTSPCVKNKMSKREFIRNLRGVISGVSDDTIGHMYDNIYLNGHVATQDT